MPIIMMWVRACSPKGAKYVCKIVHHKFCEKNVPRNRAGYPNEDSTVSISVKYTYKGELLYFEYIYYMIAILLIIYKQVQITSVHERKYRLNLLKRKQAPSMTILC